MKIAVTYSNGEIFQHFGHTQQFKVYEVENGAVVASKVIDTNGSGHGALAGVLLAFNPNVQCNHHDHQHEEGHVCGSHGCGGDHHCGGH